MVMRIECAVPVNLKMIAMFGEDKAIEQAKADHGVEAKRQPVERYTEGGYLWLSFAPMKAKPAPKPKAAKDDK